MTKVKTVKTFKVGDKVVTDVDDSGEFTSNLRYTEYDDDRLTGVVVALLPGKKVKVDWEVKHYNQPIYNQHTGQLEKYEPKAVKISALLSEKEADDRLKVLEKEFRAVEKEVKVKLQQASKLILEANKMAVAAGHESIDGMYDAVRTLYDAMNECGWRTSALNC